MYMYFRKLTISMPFAQNTYHILPPPHRRHLARSFPVPRGRTATGGRSTIPSLSMASISQPTVPSPPHTKIRAPGTSLKNCNLKKKNISNFSSFIVILALTDFYKFLKSTCIVSLSVQVINYYILVFWIIHDHLSILRSMVLLPVAILSRSKCIE